jgi:SAM-dependent methyltransferase
MYQSLEASLHDQFWHAEENANELPLLETFLEASEPVKALEVGCGSGRLLLALMAKGYQIEGVEVSQAMVDLLRAKAEKQGLTPTVHHCSIEDFNSEQLYTHITIPAFTLQLLSRPTAAACLKKLRKLAQSDAKLYITLFIPWAEILDELEPDVWHHDKQCSIENHQTAHCYTKHSIHRVMQELQREHRYEITDNDGAKIQSHESAQTLQWYFLPEIISMLQAAGWSIDTYDTDFEAGSQDPDASILTIYATAL